MPSHVHSGWFPLSLGIHWHHQQEQPAVSHSVEWLKKCRFISFKKSLVKSGVNRCNGDQTAQEKVSVPFFFQTLHPSWWNFSLSHTGKSSATASAAYSSVLLQTTSDSPGSCDGFPLMVEPVVEGVLRSGQTLFLTALSGSLFCTKSNIQSLCTLTQSSNQRYFPLKFA